MVSHRAINAPNVYRPSAAYSHAVVAGDLVFVSGIMAHHPVTGQIVGETESEQLAQALGSVKLILEAAGSSLDKVVSATLIVVEDADFRSLNEEWVKWFP